MDELNDQEELKIAIERVKINRRNLEAYDLFEAFRGQFIIASFFSAINFQAENARVTQSLAIFFLFLQFLGLLLCQAILSSITTAAVFRIREPISYSHFKEKT